ncbi:ribonuclease-like [Eublepharis macularius]|uniref:Ribonuclease-like n=1 Tax=Eublepharis macularius TaxID=481883 RepID=A0AA97LAI7_EUBMA|nr:ribonuclease-like [Eublepharis macularius]
MLGFPRTQFLFLIHSLYKTEEAKQLEEEIFCLCKASGNLSKVKGLNPRLQVDTMAPASVCPILLLLLVLLGPLPSSSQRETRHQKFQRQHVDFPKTNPEWDARRYCNLMMQRRGMSTDTCKPSNTFIHGSPEDVDAICTHGGTYSSDNFYNSNAHFEITSCRITGGSQRPPCNYRGILSSQRVQVACLNSLPVHFKRAL